MVGDDSDVIATYAIDRCEAVAQATLKRRERQQKDAAAATTDGRSVKDRMNPGQITHWA